MSRDIRSDAVYHGRHADKERDDYVRCARCGFICKLSRDRREPEGSRAGWGIKFVAVTTGTARAAETAWGESEWGDSAWGAGGPQVDTLRTLYDPTVVAGCPQCGTLLYDK